MTLFNRVTVYFFNMDPENDSFSCSALTLGTFEAHLKLISSNGSSRGPRFIMSRRAYFLGLQHIEFGSPARLDSKDWYLSNGRKIPIKVDFG